MYLLPVGSWSKRRRGTQWSLQVSTTRAGPAGSGAGLVSDRVRCLGRSVAGLFHRGQEEDTERRERVRSDDRPSHTVLATLHAAETKCQAKPT